MNIWMIVRLLIIAIAAIGSIYTPLGPQAKPPIEWNILRVFFIFCPVGLAFVIGIQYLNPKSDEIWHKPAWNENPFNFGSPLQFFHLAAYVFLVQGIVTLIRLLLSSVELYPEAFVTILIAIGIFAGLQFCSFLFRGKFEPST